ncbi:MAG: aminopeptidase P N-terminal domain-containing protein [Gammaproteobacteria bacterium]|nr:aminopeptidase P N-terminal domain-containing protein [Gammaproteobacteria bacterium]
MNMRCFSERRSRFMEEMKPNSLALIPAGSEQLRDRDIHYVFHQNSDFHYLTGYPEPQALALFQKGKGKNETGRWILFNLKKDEVIERWTGTRIGQEKACSFYGADEAHAIEDQDEEIPKLMAGCQTLYYPIGVSEPFDRRVNGWVHTVEKQVRTGLSAPSVRIALSSILHEMRLIKTAPELACMQKAVGVSCLAHERAMRVCQSATSEFQIHAELMRVFMESGCRHVAYEPIVASGENACILHYTENTGPLKSGELLLVDAGVEFEGYASDITRTYPTNGKFSPEQKALYEVVLEAQQAGIAAVKPGNHWNQPHEVVIRVLTEGLVDLKILQGSVDTLIEQKSYEKFYPHQTGHWLGLNVHDVGAYKVDEAWRIFKAGMTLTVEPGLYVKCEPEVLPKWWNIGIRIEDDVLVTETGALVMSEALPKKVADIESFMRG